MNTQRLLKSILLLLSLNIIVIVPDVSKLLGETTEPNYDYNIPRNLETQGSDIFDMLNSDIDMSLN